jgi:hypothetical protein
MLNKALTDTFHLLLHPALYNEDATIVLNKIEVYGGWRFGSSGGVPI